MTLSVFSDQFVGLHFFISYFLWNDRSLPPTFLSSLVMHNVVGCPSDFPCCPFLQCSTVSFVASFCSTSVIQWLSQSNWPEGFIIWDCRPVFSVMVVGIWGSGSVSSLGRVFTLQGTISSVWFTGSFSADKSELRVHFLQQLHRKKTLVGASRLSKQSLMSLCPGSLIFLNPCLFNLF